jgi:hypothetical protein
MHNSKKNVQLRNKFIAILMRRHLRYFYMANCNTSVIFPCLPGVVLLFGGTHKCVPKHISWFFWPTGSCVAHGMRMTVSSMFFVLIATPLGLHGGSCLGIHSGQHPHLVTYLIHEYHVDIPWISMPLRGFHDGR